ncbi:MAG TPA: Ig-like domain repeat protein [Solirubrobacteraceae bacterium]
MSEDTDLQGERTYMSTPAPRRHTCLTGAVLSLLLAAGCAGSAAAATGPSLYADGLHVATGGIVDPDGRVWVSDHNGGFCRVTGPTDRSPGTIDHPHVPGAPADVARTCLGGLLPDAAPGPDAAGAPAYYDPTPETSGNGDEIVLIPDGAAASNAVFRATWNPHDHVFEIDPAVDTIAMDADTTQPRPRPVAASIGPDGDAYVVFQRSATIQRIDDPASLAPVVELVGSTSDGRGAAAVAAGYGPFGPLGPDLVYVAETVGVRQISGVAGDASVSTQPSALDVPPPTAVSALAYEVTDPINGEGMLYAGTADALPPLVLPGPDRVLKLNPGGRNDEVAMGFSSVGGFALRPVAGGPDGLLVIDEPALAIDAQPLGMGRMFSIGAPITTILSGPSTPAGQPALEPRVTADSTPTFTFAGEFVRECSLTPAAAAANAWGRCTTAGEHTPGALADGRYRFAVRSVDGARTGPADSVTFTVDTVAPAATPRVVNPSPNGSYLKAPSYSFDNSDAGEPEAGYVCTLDDLGSDADTPAYEPCAEGRPSLPDGTYSLRVKLVDAAGNVGSVESDAVVFTVGTDPSTDGQAPGPHADLTHPTSSAQLAGGATVATGSLEDPTGRLWISDHMAGFCRLTDPSVDGPGTIEHPTLPGRPRVETRTCLGGLRPDAGEGADATGPPAFVDPTPLRPGNGDEVVIVADGFAASDTLVRFGWDPGTRRFEFRDRIQVPSVDGRGRPRPVSTAVGPDPDGATGPKVPEVFFVSKRDTYVGRVKDAAGDHPTADIVGFVSAGGRRAEVVAVGGHSVTVPPANEGDAPATEQRPVVYLVDQNGLAVLDPELAGVTNVAAGAPRATTKDVALPNIGAAVYDFDRGLLYLGTMDAIAAPADLGVDRVVRYDVAADRAVDTTGGFTMVQGLGLRRDGRVLVVDDPAVIIDGEPQGMGKLWQIGGPAARISSGPTNLPDKAAWVPAHTGDPTPSFELAGDGPLECWLRPAADTAPQWAPCATGTFTAPQLADGDWKLTVRSTAGSTAAVQTPADDVDDPTRFVPGTLRFTVDTQGPAKPSVTAVAPLVGGITNAAPMFTFAGDEGVRYSCSLNGVVKNPCRPGRTFPSGGTPAVKDGDNSLTITAIDRAGNASPESSRFVFKADAIVPTVTIAAPAEGQVTGTEARFVFKASETTGTTYGCRLDGATFKRCDSPADAGGRGEPYAIELLPGGSVQVTYRGLTPGRHRFQAHASDDHGNVSPNASRRIRVDVTAPTAIIDRPDPNETTGRSTTLTSHIDPATIGEGETNTLACMLDGAPVVAADCDESIPVGGLSEGMHTFTVQATDSAGNAGPVGSRTWHVDATAPVITIRQQGNGLLAAPTYTITTDEPAALRCRYDDRPMEECATVNGRNLGPGQHTLHVVATDAFGNVSQVSRAFSLVFASSANTSVPASITQAALRAGGLPVTFTANENTALARFEISRVVAGPALATAARAAKAAGPAGKKAAYTHLVTVTRRTPKAGIYRRRLKERALVNAMKPGVYRVQTRLRDDAGRYGEPVYDTVRVKKSKARVKRAKR